MFEGRYWTYNTNKAFCEMFPYLTGKMIRTAIQKLIDSDLIITGNYNKQAYDRTMWYALTEKGESIFLKCKKDLPVGANGFDREGEPIPDINPDSKTAYINSDKSIMSEPPGFVEFYSVYPNKVKRKDALTAWNSGKCEKITDTIVEDVKLRCRTEWKGQNQHYIPHPTTYLHQRRWEDETPPTERRNTAKEQQPVTERVYEDVTEENFDKYW
jgi:hypothetical protein